MPLSDSELPPASALANRPVGAEARKTIGLKAAQGFVERYLSGSDILDIGYRGYSGDAVPIVPQAIGIDVDYPGYDGRNLPFPDASQDSVYSSHCLEHIDDYRQAIAEWFRVIRPGGHLIIIVPNQFLYEKRQSLPSRWNQDHRRFYTPASLMTEIEQSLAPNTYRLRHLADNDFGYDYAISPEHHADGCYEIELVLQKLTPPIWDLEQPPLSSRLFARERQALLRLLAKNGARLPPQVRAVLGGMARRIL